MVLRPLTGPSRLPLRAASGRLDRPPPETLTRPKNPDEPEETQIDKPFHISAIGQHPLAPAPTVR
jgi:hypothetical protein